MKKQFLAPESILPVIALILSIANLFNPLELSSIVSLAGIVGGIMYFAGNPFASKILYAWIIAQIVIIPPYLDLSQVFNFTLGMTFNETGIYVNVLAIGMLVFIKSLEAAKAVGQIVRIHEFREGSMEGILPLEGVVNTRIDFSQEKNWLLVKPYAPFTYDGMTISHVLIKRKDGNILKRKTKNQLVFLRLFTGNENAPGLDINDYPFIDWAYADN
ncbi:hypothetical protein OGH69_05365 [Flavobacterium sp. MFBS3-15]|uniref:hypothetical protein n=1 Tax=Flavobacterium sp. MFBS3-15 TaxID=2989816 RepID=UPI002235CE4A|nr:hypothetical protein [Flavobacterium sp. MFBS3-15]MCW4468384.1 hypothetical protein [Flavobacterium sp. MFBS3-15]